MAYNPDQPLLDLPPLTHQSHQHHQHPIDPVSQSIALTRISVPLPNAPLPAGETQNWERLLSQLEEPQSALQEIRQFSEQWFPFYSSLNESYFYSIPKPVRDLVREQMRVLCAADDLGKAALSSWCSSHFATVLAKEGDERYKKYEAKASKFYSQALELLQDRTYPLPV